MTGPRRPPSILSVNLARVRLNKRAPRHRTTERDHSVVMAPAASPSDWYNSLPPVSKAWGTACFACTLLSQFGLVDLRNLYLNWALVKGKFQVWRLLTNFCFLGKFSFPFLMRMMMM